MKITAEQEMPHFDHDTMHVLIEHWNNEVRVEITVKDGGGGMENSRVIMSIEDFDRVAEMVKKYKEITQ